MTLDMQLRSAKLTLLVDELRAIELALADGVESAALDVGHGRRAIELHRELLVAEGWRRS